MNIKMKDTKGISLISLTITIMVLIILSNVIIYNVVDNLKLRKLTEMQNDIDDLRDKVSTYYMQNGKIPASIKYTNINHIKASGVISDAVDIGDFLVIDLSAIENLTLNKGQDFEKVKDNPQNVDSYTDLYIINEASHNVFYVAGVTIDNKTFYTDYNEDGVDTASVSLKYVENVQIPDGFYYVEGTKDTGITIRSNDNMQEYKWIQQKGEISNIPSDVEVENNQQEDFIKSVNAYQGYYKSVNNNKVIYLGLENWSPVYDKEGVYKDKNGDTAYIPKGFSVSQTQGENTIDKGLVVKDGNHNQWVWIEVPKTTTVYVTAGLNVTEFTEDEYTKIETDLQTYASSYRSTYTDTWYSEAQQGFENATAYNNHKKSMLKSVYENGGFYIGRYEVGTETARYSKTDDLTTPLIQRDKYPYNFITCSQAQTLANQLQTEGRTSSLMFGIQWDLVLRYIEEKGKLQNGTRVTGNMLKSDSSNWGNYSNIGFSITRGRYTASPSTANSWSDEITTSYTKPSSSILLATGATDRNSVLGIYDLAGNAAEWTLEYTTATSNPCVARGGLYIATGSSNPAFGRNAATTSYADNFIGLRLALW